jgi:hypothetical protein
MILTRLYCGLGNQLFQYAAGTALAIKHQDIARFEHSIFTRIRRHRLSMESSPLFALGLDIPEASPTDVLRMDTPWWSARHWFGKRAVRLIQRDGKVAIKIEAFARARGDIYLQGYWQSSFYFKDGQDQITRQLLALKPDPERNREWLNLLAQPGSAAVHVRRGDYLTANEEMLRYRILTPDYYRRAIQVVRAKQPIDRIIVFSDDISWCRENLNLGIPCHYVVRASTDEGMIDDFLCMASARIIFTGNSTFSWWAGWISHTRGDSTVVSPSEWFHGPSFSEWNRLLQVDSWITVPTD